MKSVELVNHQQCCGCGSCSAICPTGAILLTKDDFGFSIPIIDNSKCIKCGLCASVCPSINKPENPNHYCSKAYTGYNPNSFLRAKSRSGGVFPLLAKAIIDKGGAIYGSVLENNKTSHKRADTLDGALRMCGSKYVESFISKEILKQLIFDLKSGRVVLFSGTPCQCRGVYLLSKAVSTTCLNKLYLVSVLCFGSMSPNVVEDYLSHYGSESVQLISFRDKTKGWASHFERLEINGKTLIRNRLAALYNSGAFKRDSCYACEFACQHQFSDITLADAWSLEKYWNPEEAKKGISLVLTNTEKGEELLNECQWVYKSVSKEEVLNNTRRPNLFNPPVLTDFAKEQRQTYKSNRSSFRDVEKKCYNHWRKLLRRSNLSDIYQLFKRFFHG